MRAILVGEFGDAWADIGHGLERAGWTIQSASPGTRIDEVRQQDQATVVVVADQGEDVTGLRLCRQVRETDLAAALIVLRSTPAGKGTIAAYLAAGADDIVVAPATHSEVFRRLVAMGRLASSRGRQPE